MKVAEVAAALNIGQGLVRKLIRSGDLPAVKLTGRVLRVLPKDARAYLAARRRESCQRTAAAMAQTAAAEPQGAEGEPQP